MPKCFSLLNMIENSLKVNWSTKRATTRLTRKVESLKTKEKKFKLEETKVIYETAGFWKPKKTDQHLPNKHYWENKTT